MSGHNPKLKCIDLKEQFGDKYRVRAEGDIKKNRDPWLWEIRCRRGIIYPFGGETLCAMVTAPRIANRIKGWKGFEVWQNADDATVFKFDVKLIKKIVTEIKPYVRRKVSDEQRKNLAKRAAKARAARM